MNSEKTENDNLQNSLASCQSGLLAGLDMDLWHENFVNGEYVIAFELNDDLDSNVKRMLPKVRP